MEESDLDVLNRMRNVCVYQGKKNSLVEWTDPASITPTSQEPTSGEVERL